MKYSPRNNNSNSENTDNNNSNTNDIHADRAGTEKPPSTFGSYSIALT